MNRNWTGKLQVTLLSSYISWTHFQGFFGRNNRTLRKWKQDTCMRLCERIFRDFLSKRTPSNGYVIVFEKHLWNSLLLYRVVEILQLLHEIPVFQRCSIREVFWKTSQNSHINTRSSQKKRCRYFSVKFANFLKNNHSFVSNCRGAGR